MVSPEAVPFSKTGGLGDVAGALPLALATLGHDVTLVVPRYRRCPTGPVVQRLALQLGGRVFQVAFVEQQLGERARAILVDCPELYDRPDLYGTGSADYPDNAMRFALLSLAALEFVAISGKTVDVLHTHDWQAGLAPVYLRTRFNDHSSFRGAAAVFTIHNLAYQGLFPPPWMPALDLGWELFAIDGLEYWGKVSFLKGGIHFSEIITTVSRRYAKEIQTEEYGFGFDGILRRRNDDLIGIRNGIDVDIWNPLTDPHLPRPFGADSLDEKQASRRALRERMGLPTDAESLARPVVGIVSRMVDQKGFDMIAALSSQLPELDAAFVLLGSGEAQYQQQWLDLAARFPQRFAARIGFDESLAHLIEAGADIFLMPSRFEPCGLNQMYSLRYGTVPVVRATGGLDDTITSWSSRSSSGNGVKFKDATPGALLAALEKALALYRDPATWRTIQQNGMSQDFSWTASAAEYTKAYEKALRRTRQGNQ
jgi:starch synthase